MIRRPETIDFWVGDLPHWEVVDGRYFVTIHLRGAIPQAGFRRIRELAASFRNPQLHKTDQALELHRQIFQEMESWLDRAEYAPHLRVPEVAEIVMEAVLHRQTQGVWRIFEYVVMPNHLFFELTGGRLKPVLENFKTWTGGQAARILKLDGTRFWQGEWFDHWSRSDDEDERIMAYIRRNPVKAGLTDWPYGGWSR